MKILLIQNAFYLPTLGGANKANRLIMEALARQGHDCQVLAPASGGMVPDSFEEYCQQLRERHIVPTKLSNGTLQFSYRGVTITAVNSAVLRSCVSSTIRTCNPDWIFVSSEDPLQQLLGAVLAAHPLNVIYLAHTTILLPFGPGSMCLSERGTSLIRRAKHVLVISTYMKDYIKKCADIEAKIVNLPIFESVPVDISRPLRPGHIFLLNPCAVKGLDLFLTIADALSDLPFAVVPTWGTTIDDLQKIKLRTNIEICASAEDIGVVLQGANLLLVPSLWAESFGMIVIEAMLRGIPVLASDLGGLPEAKCGVEFLIGVNEITEYTGRLDSKMMPQAIIPKQDCTEWVRHIRHLYFSEDEYNDLSRRSAEAAGRYVATLSIDPLEELLRRA